MNFVSPSPKKMIPTKKNEKYQPLEKQEVIKLKPLKDDQMI